LRGYIGELDLMVAALAQDEAGAAADTLLSTVPNMFAVHDSAHPRAPLAAHVAPARVHVA
jgi:hypothetical protein